MTPEQKAYLNQLEVLGNVLIDQHLRHWTFQWDARTVHFGSTQFNSRVIAISRDIALHNDVAAFKEAMLHEIAHAATGEREHNDNWRHINLYIGGNGKPQVDRSRVKLPGKRRLRYF